MNLSFKRNIWIIAGILFATILKVTIGIPHVNILFSIFCFYKAYQINKLIDNNRSTID